MIKPGDTSDLLGLGPVAHDVDTDNQAISNTTLPGHLLHPGKVERQVIQRGDMIYVRTYGDGIGDFGRLNEALAGALWGTVDNGLNSVRGESASECGKCN